MTKVMTAISTALLLSLLFSPAGSAAETGIQIQTAQITVEFGMQSNAIMAAPNNLQFERGKVYELIISNTSDRTHYLVPAQFSRAVRTLKLNSEGAKIQTLRTTNPRASKVKNEGRFTVDEIELRSGGKAVWTFIPVTAGNYILKCGIPSHTAAGMKVSFKIT